MCYEATRDPPLMDVQTDPDVHRNEVIADGIVPILRAPVSAW